MNGNNTTGDMNQRQNEAQEEGQLTDILDLDAVGDGELVLVLDEVGQGRSFVAAAIDRNARICSGLCT